MDDNTAQTAPPDVPTRTFIITVPAHEKPNWQRGSIRYRRTTSWETPETQFDEREFNARPFDATYDGGKCRGARVLLGAMNSMITTPAEAKKIAECILAAVAEAEAQFKPVAYGLVGAKAIVRVEPGMTIELIGDFFRVIDRDKQQVGPLFSPFDWQPTFLTAEQMQHAVPLATFTV